VRHFKALLAAEENGRDPVSLSTRWLALSAMTWRDRGPKVKIELPARVSHLLDDADVRAKDQQYAAAQRVAAWEWLDG
jgi:hypothetical protein